METGTPEQLLAELERVGARVGNLTRRVDTLAAAPKPSSASSSAANLQPDAENQPPLTTKRLAKRQTRTATRQDISLLFDETTQKTSASVETAESMFSRVVSMQRRVSARLDEDGQVVARTVRSYKEPHLPSYTPELSWRRLVTEGVSSPAQLRQSTEALLRHAGLCRDTRFMSHTQRRKAQRGQVGSFEPPEATPAIGYFAIKQHNVLLVDDEEPLLIKNEPQQQQQQQQQLQHATAQHKTEAPSPPSAIRSDLVDTPDRPPFSMKQHASKSQQPDESSCKKNTDTDSPPPSTPPIRPNAFSLSQIQDVTPPQQKMKAPGILADTAQATPPHKGSTSTKQLDAPSASKSFGSQPAAPATSGFPKTTSYSQAQPAKSEVPSGFGKQPAASGFGNQPAAPATSGFPKTASDSLPQPAKSEVPAGASGFAKQPAASGFGNQPAAAGTFGKQPAAPGAFGNQPAAPAAPGAFGNQPAASGGAAGFANAGAKQGAPQAAFNSAFGNAQFGAKQAPAGGFGKVTATAFGAGNASGGGGNVTQFAAAPSGGGAFGNKSSFGSLSNKQGQPSTQPAAPFGANSGAGFKSAFNM